MRRGEARCGEGKRDAERGSAMRRGEARCGEGGATRRWLWWAGKSSRKPRRPRPYSRHCGDAIAIQMPSRRRLHAHTNQDREKPI